MLRRLLPYHWRTGLRRLYLWLLSSRDSGSCKSRNFTLEKVINSPVWYEKAYNDEKCVNKLSILYVAPWLMTGGADTMTIDWFRALDGEWSEKYFVSTLPGCNNWLPKIIDYASGIYDLPALGYKRRAEMVEFIIDIIARKKIDILHIMNSEVAFDALPELKERFPALKVVAQFHCFDYLPNGSKAGYPYDIPPRYDHLVDSYNLEYSQLGGEIRELYPYICQNKFKVIHGSIDGCYFNPDRDNPGSVIDGKRHPGKLNLLFIGRLDRQKQPLRLIDIALELYRQQVDFVMHVIGDGNLESQKRGFLARRGKENLQNHIVWYGEQPFESMKDWYKIADILLLTSDWEGVPMVLYQAMAMRLVPVVADVGGCAELLTPECGYLIGERDNPAAYVAAIKALADQGVRRKMADAARKRMLEEFSLRNINRKYREYYRSLFK